MAMRKCKACGAGARKLQRAIVLTPGGRGVTGQVCAGCARLGWLLVVGDIVPPAPRKRAAGRTTLKGDRQARAAATLKAWGLNDE